jgi:hypothetical protein
MGFGGGGTAGQASGGVPKGGTGPIAPSTVQPTLSCKGYWRLQDSQPMLPRALWLCHCYWLCIDCDSPVMWSGNKYDLPSTVGQLFFDPSTRPSAKAGNVQRGNNCLCTRKPGPETGCPKC